MSKVKTAVTASGEKITIRPGFVVKNGKRHYVFPKPSPELLALRKKQRAEQERNNKIFDAQLPKLLKKRRGQHVVMKSGKMVGFYPSLDEAMNAADKRYPSRVYSLHTVDDSVIDLGIFSCV